jgi:malonyl-CoA/methylmalonyl-CoA synthetase
MAEENMYAVLARGFPEDRSKVAIETPELRYTYDDIDRATACLANLLVSLDLPDGARVAAQVEKSPEALLLYLATLRAGYVYLPLNPAYRESEVAYFLRDAEPSVVVCTPENAEWVQSAAAGAPQPVHFFTLNESRGGSLLEAAGGLSQRFDTVARGSADLAAILYTSGTTGRSKGAMLSHGNLSANARTLHTYWGWRTDDVLLHMLPIFHVHGLFVAAHGALLAGASMIWLPKLDVALALRYLPRTTVFMGVPTYYVRLLAEPRFTRALVANVRLFISGSAPLLTETFTQFQERIGTAILERYGMSETNMLTSNPLHALDGARLGGTVGRPLPGVSVRVVSDEDAMLTPGEIGHIQVRGPNVFSGYWRMPEKTREAFTQDGWFRTGDVGQWGDGKASPPDYLSIVGRSKDLIITGGFNVYPKEIETVIDEIAGVEESAVIGVPHPDFGEAVIAVIVAKAGAALDTQQILAALKQRIANFKVPKRIVLVDQLPRNTMGKVQKNMLRDAYGN